MTQYVGRDVEVNTANEYRGVVTRKANSCEVVLSAYEAAVNRKSRSINQIDRLGTADAARG
jgi:hypothetical protein